MRWLQTLTRPLPVVQHRGNMSQQISMINVRLACITLTALLVGLSSVLLDRRISCSSRVSNALPLKRCCAISAMVQHQQISQRHVRSKRITRQLLVEDSMICTSSKSLRSTFGLVDMRSCLSADKIWLGRYHNPNTQFQDDILFRCMHHLYYTVPKIQLSKIGP